jgi:valyl-tRNA synthetase
MPAASKPTLDKIYDPRAVEERVTQLWSRHDFSRPSGTGSPYCIMLPPPNVTGTLHMGHAFQDTLMDALVRYQRMRGRRVLWQPGIDHAGIATQMVVERELARVGLDRAGLGRDAFLERVWAWKERSGATIVEQMKRIGASADWSRLRFTMDEGLSKAVREAFVRLYDEGLIYRGPRLVNWDPKLLTALSDLEVQTEEGVEGELYVLRYPLAEPRAGQTHLSVATTRPETLLGDVALAVHPEDARYREFVGARVRLPLTERTIPVLADPMVDPTFGTGVVKITPAHDPHDFDLWKRRGANDRLPLFRIFDVHARIQDPARDLEAPRGEAALLFQAPEGHEVLELAARGTLVPRAYVGLARVEARKRILEDLAARGLLERCEPHRMTLPRGDRSGAVLEPYLTVQWFVRTAPLARPLLTGENAARPRFVPDAWRKTYEQWLERIEDWCISRQLWWGHRIPAWYGDDGRIYVARDEDDLERRYPGIDRARLERDEDVLDTWFSSALWPFSTLGWPDETPDLAAFYPGDVLVTGFDIIFFWVARMAMMGERFLGRVPFRDVYIHALVRDSEGQKMSKSKGNVLDPLDLIDGIAADDLVVKRTAGLLQPQRREAIAERTRREFPEGIPGYGADAVRYTFAALAAPGRDVRFDLARVAGYRSFCTKLWNAGRFVLLQLDEVPTEESARAAGANGADDGPAERWIRARLAAVVEDAHRSFATYRFDLLAQRCHEFAWGEFCDWYLELAKIGLRDSASTPRRRAAIRRTLLETYETLLRLLHPLVPFVTEELWQALRPHLDAPPPSIMVAPYPEVGKLALSRPEEVEDVRWIVGLVEHLRRSRTALEIPPAQRCPLLFRTEDEAVAARLERLALYVRELARLSSLRRLDPHEALPAHSRPADARAEIELYFVAPTSVNKTEELARVRREEERCRSRLEACRARLENPSFRTRAPREVLAREEERCAEEAQTLLRLQERRRALEEDADEE